MTDWRRLAEEEFALICSAGGTNRLDELFGDHHIAFERIWQFARASHGLTRKDVEWVQRQSWGDDRMSEEQAHLANRIEALLVEDE